jgi:HlyD family secretion protein
MMWEFTITWIEDEGSQVTRGEPVLRFDGQALQERLQVLRSRVDTARSELEKARLDHRQAEEQLKLERSEIDGRRLRLEQKLAVPESIQARLELDKLRLDEELIQEELRLLELRTAAQASHGRSSVVSAENRVASLERETAQMMKNIESLEVRAPRDGYVVHVEDWNDEKPKVGATVWAGQSILEIADLHSMEVEAEVAERDAHQVSPGQRVEVRLDASPDRVFAGKIERLGKLFHAKSQDVPTMVFDAMVMIDEPDGELMRPGMAARVEILAPSTDDVIQVPESAVRMTPRGPVVEVREGVGWTQVEVTLGPRWDRRVVVLSGLEDGDVVAVQDDAS